MRKPVPASAPRFQEGHVVTFSVTVLSGLISALALGFHIYEAAALPELVKWAFVVLGSLFAFGMAMTPISLARAHGESMEGGNAQSGILFIVLMVMCVDGALQVHAIDYLSHKMSAPASNIWYVVAGAALFQLSLFFVRGALYGATREIQELIDARQHELDMAAEYARQKQLAERREKYAQKRLHVV